MKVRRHWVAEARGYQPLTVAAVLALGEGDMLARERNGLRGGIYRPLDTQHLFMAAHGVIESATPREVLMTPCADEAVDYLIGMGHGVDRWFIIRHGEAAPF